MSVSLRCLHFLQEIDPFCDPNHPKCQYRFFEVTVHRVVALRGYIERVEDILPLLLPIHFSLMAHTPALYDPGSDLFLVGTDGTSIGISVTRQTCKLMALPHTNDIRMPSETAYTLH